MHPHLFKNCEKNSVAPLPKKLMLPAGSDLFNNSPTCRTYLMLQITIIGQTWLAAVLHELLALAYDFRTHAQFTQLLARLLNIRCCVPSTKHVGNATCPITTGDERAKRELALGMKICANSTSKNSDGY